MENDSKTQYAVQMADDGKNWLVKGAPGDVVCGMQTDSQHDLSLAIVIADALKAYAETGMTASVMNKELVRLSERSVADAETTPQPDALGSRELATVLAALRNYQVSIEDLCGEIPWFLADVATGHGRVKPLGLNEIDDLCERLNAGGGAGCRSAARGEDLTKLLADLCARWDKDDDADAPDLGRRLRSAFREAMA